MKPSPDIAKPKLEEAPHWLTRWVFRLGSPIDRQEEELGCLIERFREKQSLNGYTISEAQEWAWGQAVSNFRFGPWRNLYLVLRCLRWLLGLVPWITGALLSLTSR